MILVSLFKKNMGMTIIEKVYIRFIDKESRDQKEKYANWLNNNK